MLTSICRIVTICSGLYLLIGMTRFSKYHCDKRTHKLPLEAGAIPATPDYLSNLISSLVHFERRG